MRLSDPVSEIRRLGTTARIGAIVLAEQAVDLHVAAYASPDDRCIALDILLRDFARLRTREPALDGFIGEVESYIDLLYRDLARCVA